MLSSIALWAIEQWEPLNAGVRSGFDSGDFRQIRLRMYMEMLCAHNATLFGRTLDA